MHWQCWRRKRLSRACDQSTTVALPSQVPKDTSRYYGLLEVHARLADGNRLHMKEFRLKLLVAYINEWLGGRMASLEKLAKYAAVRGNKNNQGQQF